MKRILNKWWMLALVAILAAGFWHVSARDSGEVARLEAALRTGRPTLVYLFTPTCEVCQQVTPVIEQLAQRVPQLQVIAIDVSRYRDIAAYYRVQGVPTFALYNRAGQQVYALTGAPNEELAQRIGMVLEEAENAQGE